MKNPVDGVTGLFVSTDQKDWQEVEQFFASTVLLDYSSMNGNPASELSPEQIINTWKSILPDFEHTHHQLGNFTSEVDGQNASVFCYGTATHFLPDKAGSIWTVVGTYDFNLSQDLKGNWKITLMKFNFKYQNGNANLVEKAMNKLK